MSDGTEEEESMDTAEPETLSRNANNVKSKLVSGLYAYDNR